MGTVTLLKKVLTSLLTPYLGVMEVTGCSSWSYISGYAVGTTQILSMNISLSSSFFPKALMRLVLTSELISALLISLVSLVEGSAQTL